MQRQATIKLRDMSARVSIPQQYGETHLEIRVCKSPRMAAGTKWCTLCILFYDGVEIISRMYTEQVYFYDC